MVKIGNENNFELYEFEKTYDFSVEVPIINEETWEETGEIETIVGQVTFLGEAEWNSLDQKYSSDFYWKESTERFSQDGNAPDKEDDFVQDFKEYLLQIGVAESEIGW
ncbi:hypothetical protein [Enterococcus sp. AZ163]|uniref:hypothetical protein n=1 Tax=Enterococcus sp. AZ163 TaxID=2774638 RepID=UPI003D2A89BF